MVHVDPTLRNSVEGHPVKANDPIIIEHCATSKFLASDKINYRNDFGSEFEVSVHSYCTTSKNQ